LIENLTANQIPFDLRTAVNAAGALQPVSFTDEVQAEVLAFITGRLEGLLRDQDVPASVVKAVLAEQAHDPYAAQQTAVALQSAIAADDWETLLDAYARCVRITRTQDGVFTLHPDAFTLPEEQALAAAYAAARAAQDGSVEALVSALRALQPVISLFFENVLVMDEDTAVRHNRLALLQHIAALADGLADLSYLEGF